MGLIAKRGDSKSFEPVSEGLHPAVCWAVIDLGIQPKTGGYAGQQWKVYIGFDVLDQSIEFEKDNVKQTGPMRIGLTVSNSLDDKAHLRKYAEKWRGRPFTEKELEGFDLRNMVGAPCQLVVTHAHKNDKVYANIDNILAWPKGTPKPPPPAESLFFSLADHDFEQMRPRIPKWLAERLDRRLADNWDEFNQKVAPAAPTRAAHEDSNGGGDFDDDIPF